MAIVVRGAPRSGRARRTRVCAQPRARRRRVAEHRHLERVVVLLERVVGVRHAGRPADLRHVQPRVDHADAAHQRHLAPAFGIAAAQRVAQAREPALRVAACGERVGHRHRDEARLMIRLHLADQVQVRADDRADRRVAAARHRVAVQDDRLDAGRHLDRADRVARVDDVRRIGARAERLLALAKAQRAALPVAVADPVGLRRDDPRILEERAGRFVGEPVMIEARQHAQFGFARERRAHRIGQRRAFAGRALRRADRQRVALLQTSALVAADRAERIRRAAAEHDGHVDAARDREIRTRALLHVVERQRAARADTQRDVARLRRAVDARRHLGARHRDQRVAAKQQLRAEQRAFEDGRVLVVADEQVRRAQRELIERAGRRDADVIVAVTAGVLHGRREARLHDLDRVERISWHPAPRRENGCTRADRAGTPRARTEPASRAA